MGRCAKAVVRKTDTFPWYEWVKEYEWDDEPGSDRFDDIQAKRGAADQLDKWHESIYRSEKDDALAHRGIEGTVCV